MKAIYLSVIILFFSPFHSWAQVDPYQLNKKLDSNILGASSLLLMVDFGLNSQRKALNENQILALNPNEINNFDRFAVNHYSSSAEIRSDIGRIAPLGIGAIAGLGICLSTQFDFSRSLNLVVIGIEANLLNYLLTDLTKLGLGRIRPYVYNPEVELEEKLKKSARKSFFSGHTSFSAVNSYFLAKVFSDYYPDSKWKGWIWLAASVIPAWTGVERVLAGKHFPTDVITGYTVGALCGYIIPEIHRKVNKNEKKASFQIGPSSQIAGLSLKWIF